ncbi:MAG: hypothetical protein RRZ42_00630 [Oscillospiraceae bacterium]
MADYRRLYFKLFNVITAAMDEISGGNAEMAYYLMFKAQTEAEGIIIEGEDDIKVINEEKYKQ